MTAALADPIAIVEVALMSALGVSLDETCEALRGDRCGVRPGASLEQLPAVAAGVGEVPLETAEASASRAELLLRATFRQLRCLDSDDADGKPALVLGTTLGGMRHCGEAIRAESAGDATAALAACRSTPSAAVVDRALQGSRVGPMRISLSCACASALSAIAHACSLIRAGMASWAIAGGYDPISEFAYAGFSALQLVAAGPLSPFAEEREGMKLGEGCALYALRPLAEALRRGERVIGVIEAIGESSDSHHLTQPHPQGRGAAAVLSAACRGGEPDLLVAHATGTPGNDAAEYEAYRATFGDRLSAVPVTALKSRFGHPLGAAGALELAVALGCSDRGFLPAGVGRPSDRSEFPELRLLHGSPQPREARRIVALAAGFGGANVAISVRRDATAFGSSDVAVSKPSLSGLGIRAIGAVSAGGRGVEGLHALSGLPAQAVPDEILAPLLDRARTRRIALLPRLMLAAVRDLLDRSGLCPSDLEDVPLIAATWHGAIGFTESYYRDLFRSGIDLANPMLFAESVPNIGSAHVSLGFGIRAASLSVVGSRAGGFQAIALADARIRSGSWSRALGVAAEESHPLVNAALSSCLGEEVVSGSAAVAMLVERASSHEGDVIHGVTAGSESMEPGGRRVISSSACDAPWRQQSSRTSGIPELGAATGLALLATEFQGVERGSGERFVVVSQDPGGAAWRLTATIRHADRLPPQGNDR
jgi:3-oxoacyl-[acyl-carrier-protein] synthase II